MFVDGKQAATCSQNQTYPVMNSGTLTSRLQVHFLDTWSRYDLDAYCLAMLFAYREFDDGVLGLAWVAGTGGKVGGICQQRVCYTTV